MTITIYEPTFYQSTIDSLLKYENDVQNPAENRQVIRDERLCLMATQQLFSCGHRTHVEFADAMHGALRVLETWSLRPTTIDDYFAAFPTQRNSLEFQEYVLQAGEEFLPYCALAVLDGEEPTSEYWDFLLQQLEESERDSLHVSGDCEIEAKNG
jgi:hypothetical protein